MPAMPDLAPQPETWLHRTARYALYVLGFALVVTGAVVLWLAVKYYPYFDQVGEGSLD